MNPKISIIVPVYKVEKYLAKCIDSILAQTFKDFEVILVNDGSPDRCGEICEEYAKKDNRIKVIHKENGGQASARNIGLDIAEGEYIGFVDSDDWIKENMYEVLYKEIEKTYSDLSCCKINHVKDLKIKNNAFISSLENKKELYKNQIYNILFSKNYLGWGPCNKLYRFSKIRDVRFPDGRIYEDVIFNLFVYNRIEKVTYIPKYLYNYRFDNVSTTRREVTLKRLDAIQNIFDNYKILPTKYQEIWLKQVYSISNQIIVEIVNEKNILKKRQLFYSLNNILRGNKEIVKQINLELLKDRILFKLIYCDSFLFAIIYRIGKEIKNIFKRG